MKIRSLPPFSDRLDHDHKGVRSQTKKRGLKTEIQIAQQAVVYVLKSKVSIRFLPTLFPQSYIG